ncbi:run domain Beclin-1-interacting and cysteine-rich domain-containing protein [Ceratina calcarata]|uniref:Run domain Beclin-1-interacting and cysteine-rich domain-containing protein n=1 Tax=Ceratina calcarata TaxID=156304 RepID=A0AAJ7N3T7_9HYME|nr:run domain Beclin-1-interacting and cysteine-rich domain-containing protein [Ceratina calcarata]
MCEDVHVKEQWQLLQNLRTTVEGLLVDGVLNVWNVYGGLNRLHNVMERIFKHGCRIYNRNGEPDCWVFIQGLNWLQPSLALSPVVSETEDYLSNLPARITSHKDMLWLYKSLESHSLSQKLSWLLSDKEHLLSSFEPWAFLCQENLPKASPQKHRRSSSYPINLSTTSFSMARDKTVHIEKYQLESLKVVTGENFVQRDDLDSVTKNQDETLGSKEINDIPLKTWSSLSTLTKNCKSPGKNVSAISPNSENSSLQKNNESQTSAELSKIIDFNYAELRHSTPMVADKPLVKPRTPTRRHKSTTKVKRKSEVTKKSSEDSDVMNNEEIPINMGKEYSIPSPVPNKLSTTGMKMSQNPRRTSFLSGSAPEFTGPWNLEIEGQKDIRTPKKSFMEDGGSSVQPMAIGYFPRPAEGQSLTSFLASAQFSRANAELDRENAHFSVSEAMIAAIEQVKCNRQWRLVEEATEESDEEINNLKQRIRLRRRERQEERCKGRIWNRELLSDGKTDTTTTDQSVSPLSTSSDTASGNISTDDVEDLEVDDVRNAFKLRNAAISVSMASLYSDDDLFQSSPTHGTESTLTEGSMSAEGVALSLLSRFNEKQLPRASELQWLVSEKDVPQRLLPLPKSWPINPDDAENTQSIPLRGTTEWAPPRAQIIFTPHPPPVRRTLIAKQNYYCAGCGMKVAVKYANKFRYCEYLGRYFCTGCHTNQVAHIPGKILSKWDFNRYSVSNFSYRLLDQMTTDPLFQVNDLNPSLYRRIKQLERTRLLRTQLCFFKDFLFTCRFATSVQEILKKEPNYMISKPHVYSIQDLIHVKYGTLPMRLQGLIQMCNMHIVGCEFCQARGFVCELCCSKDVIFPWEFAKVTRCEMCGACYHKKCKQNFTKADCPRCIRFYARRLSKEEQF